MIPYYEMLGVIVDNPLQLNFLFMNSPCGIRVPSDLQLVIRSDRVPKNGHCAFYRVNGHFVQTGNTVPERKVVFFLEGSCSDDTGERNGVFAMLEFSNFPKTTTSARMMLSPVPLDYYGKPILPREITDDLAFFLKVARIVLTGIQPWDANSLLHQVQAELFRGRSNGFTPLLSQWNLDWFDKLMVTKRVGDSQHEVIMSIVDFERSFRVKLP